jgi:hypothetical protein
MVTLKVVCPTKRDFAEKFLDQFPNGGFFVPTRVRPNLGDPVMVSVRIGSRATPVFLRASVRGIQRGKRTPKVRAGVSVEFLPSEARGRDHLLSIARPDMVGASARRHLRVPVDLPIRWSVRGKGDERAGLLHDISSGGARIRTKDWIAERADAVVTIFPPGAAGPMEMLARVAWTEPGTCFGVSWRVRDRGGARRIKELVRRLEQLTNDRESHYAIADARPFPTSTPISPPASTSSDKSGSLGDAAPAVGHGSPEWQEFNRERSYRVRDYGQIELEVPRAAHPPVGAMSVGTLVRFEARGLGRELRRAPESQGEPAPNFEQPPPDRRVERARR